MPYNSVRYIAYQVPTISTSTETHSMTHSNVNLRGRNKALYRIPAGQIRSSLKLSGNLLGNLSDDSKTRIFRLMGVLERSRRLIENGFQTLGADNIQTLKIFMVPEFYFRPDKSERSYSEKEAEAIKNVLLETIKSIKRIDPNHPKKEINAYQDWVIVCGTILSKKRRQIKLKTNSDSISGDDATSQLNGYFNTCVVIKQGATLIQIEKRAASTIDGLPTGAHDSQTKYDPDKKAAPDLFPDHINMANLRKHFFNVGGVEIGLEICLEHEAIFRAGNYWLNPMNPNHIVPYRYGVLKDAIIQDPSIPHNRITKVQLLPSGGMPLKPPSLVAYNPQNQQAAAAARFAYAFRNDGSLCPLGGQYTEGHRILGPVVAGPNFVNSSVEAMTPIVATTPGANTPNVGLLVNQNFVLERTITGAYLIPQPANAVTAAWNNHAQCIRFTGTLPF